MPTKRFENLKFNKQDLVPAYQVLLEKGGYNAEIMYAAFADGRTEVTARYGAKKGGFTYNEALDKYRDLLQYQLELETCRVPLPKILKIVIEYDHAAERAMVLKTSAWTGKDVHCLLGELDARRDRKKILSLVRQMCRILVPLCKDRLAGWETRVGIDPRASNFTLDERGKMWFVDLFPPRYRKQGQPIIEWPEPKNELGRRLGYFKHYDVRGIMLCTMAQLARVKPELKADFEAGVIGEMSKAFSPKEKKDFASGLAAAPWKRIRGLARRKGNSARALMANTIRGAVAEKVFGIDYYVYTLREIALELAGLGWLKKDSLEKFFRDSHFEDELPGAVLAELAERLVKACGKIR